MNNVLQLMVDKYQSTNKSDKQNIIKEIIQEIALSGLSRGGFFTKAAFYGDTCLRIFHGLNRFSEDLDFALLEQDKDFSFDEYIPYIEKEFSSYGIKVEFEIRNKDIPSDIESAFIKSNTLNLMMYFFPNSNDNQNILLDQKIKIKFEVDKDNPKGWNVITKYNLLPSPYEVKVFDESTLFAGKIHAILCRNYKNRVKGRDYYDYLFYVAKGCKINLEYLENKLKHTGNVLKDNKHLTPSLLKDLLRDKFSEVNYESAIKDVSNFIDDTIDISNWKKDLFISTLDKLVF